VLFAAGQTSSKWASPGLWRLLGRKETSWQLLLLLS
jgi:hypothetical protein